MVRVVIGRRAKPGKANELDEAIYRLRAKARNQPGYIYGENLRGYDDPCLVLVISTWASIEAWRRWEQSSECSEQIALINKLIEGEAKTSIWSPSGTEE
jgi:heme-degrading monooxygenase HmoA